jgi:hypothetical protein
MSLGRVRPSRTRWASVFALATAMYALVLGAGELQHHDLACHLKSRTHCTSCVSGVSGPGVAPVQEPQARDLSPLGRIATDLQLISLAPALAPSLGRSPPAA